LPEEGRDKDQGIMDDLPAEFEGIEHQKKELFQCFHAPRWPEAGRHHNLSKLLEIKGYEVFGVDSNTCRLWSAKIPSGCAPQKIRTPRIYSHKFA
jgi:hypothetical protein